MVALDEALSLTLCASVFFCVCVCAALRCDDGFECDKKRHNARLNVFVRARSLRMRASERSLKLQASGR